MPQGLCNLKFAFGVWADPQGSALVGRGAYPREEKIAVFRVPHHYGVRFWHLGEREATIDATTNTVCICRPAALQGMT